MIDLMRYVCTHCQRRIWVRFDWGDRFLLEHGWHFVNGNAYCLDCRERQRKRKGGRR